MMARDHHQPVRKVADRLKVSEAAVRGWIRQGGLRAIEIGKGRRIADSDLEAFLSSHATRAKGATDEGIGSGVASAAGRETGA